MTTTLATLATPATLVHTELTPLETGWLASTPDGDNIVLDASRAMRQAWADLAGSGGHRQREVDDIGLSLTDSGSPSLFANTAHLTRPLGPGDVERLHTSLDEFFAAAPGGPFLLYSPWPTGDLRAIGLQPVGHPPLMVRWVPTPPAAVHDGLVVREATTAKELAHFEQALIKGYPVPELTPFRAGAFLAPPALDTGWRFFVGYQDGRPVAGAASFATATVTLIEMVATLPVFRGRGLGAALTAAACAATPDRRAVLISSDDGRHVYERLGFVAVQRFTLWVGGR